MSKVKENESSALDPVSRSSEILFGLIMVLTFTSSIRAANFVREDVSEILLGALGCNLAWGIIDAVLYLMNIVTENAKNNLPLVRGRDLWNALIVFALVFMTIFPVSLPFFFMTDVNLALRISNLIALILLYMLGAHLGAHVGRSHVRWGLAMALTGALLVMIAVRFGG